MELELILEKMLEDEDGERRKKQRRGRIGGEKAAAAKKMLEDEDEERRKKQRRESGGGGGGEEVMYSKEQVWALWYYPRPSGNLAIPAFTVGWLQFVRAKRIKVGNELTFYGHQVRAVDRE
ncbi:hypothetical protein LWI29_035578 [Acer saccharum]|uniref:TF-B3 domain-containing protein n=1 Tax=Acer saccharum TaxID=4024 RepID=A0AA39T8X4_ACESA|nr:hypothetical protein LWI29_035578 [Acer saccharum]